MNEFQAAFGLLELELIEREIQDHKRLTERYRRGLKGIAGIRYQDDVPGVTHNYGYFPVLVDQKKYGYDRNALHVFLKAMNIYTRKYFYPLCSDYACYSDLPSARRVSSQVLCLSLHYDPFEYTNIGKSCTVLR
jgi:dTDP-4-amino-4,6-dideoxygalactose transaminase